MSKAPLGEMIIELGLDSTDFGKSLKKAKNEVKYWSNDMKTNMRVADLAGSQLSKLEAKYTGLTKTIEAQRKVVDSYKDSFDKSFVDGKVTESTVKYARQVKQAESVLQGYNLALQRTVGEMAEAEVRTTGWTGKLNDHSEKLISAGGKIEQFGATAKNVGDALTMGVTAPLAGLGTAAVKAASDWETAAAGMRKTNDEIVDSNGNVIFSHEELENQIRSLAKEIPVSAKELAGLAETAGQLGIESNKVAQFTETVAKMGVATNMSAEDAATSMAQFLNVTGSGADTVQNLASAVVELGNNTAATESDIMNMSQRWATTGAMIGLADDEIVAISAALLSMGVNVEAGGSALQRFGSKLNSAVLDGGANLEKFAQVANMSASEFATAWEEDPARAMEGFLKGLDEFQQSGGNANQLLKDLGITSVQEVNAVLALARGHDDLNKALDMSADAYKENSTLNEEAAEAFDTLQNKLELLKNKVTDVLIEFGGPLVDALTDAIDAAEPWIEKASEMAEWFSSLSEEQQRNIIKWVAFAAALGPVLSTGGRVVETVGQLTGGLGKLGKGLIDILAKNAGKKAMEEFATSAADASIEVGKLSTSATSAGKSVSTAGTLAFNPWIVGAAAAVAAIGGIGYALYRNATEPARRHKESIDETDGAYEEWFDGVMKGRQELVRLNDEVKTGSKESADAYRSSAKEIQEANADIQNSLEATFDEGLFNNTHKFFQGNLFKQFSLELDNLNVKLKEFGASESEINRIKEAFNNYGIQLGNTSGEITRFFESGQKVTADWAQSQIASVDKVTSETISALNEQRQARIDNLNSQLENNLITEQQYNDEVEMINRTTQEKINALKTSQQSITEILSSASQERRSLTEEEVLSMVTSLQKISKTTGESLSDNEEMMKLLGDNMEFLTQKTTIESLERMGVLDKEAINQLKNAETTEEALQVISDALDDYGAKEIPPKDLELNTDLSLEKIDEILEKVGVEWNNLSPEEQELLMNVKNGEDLEQALVQLGQWETLDIPEKVVVLQEQLHNGELNTAIENAGLWNDLEFVEQFASIDTNADDSNQKIAELMYNWGLVESVEEAKQLLTTTNAPDTTNKLEQLGYTVRNIDGTDVYIPSDTSSPLTEEEVNSLGLKSVDVNGTKVYIPSDSNSPDTQKLVANLQSKANQTNGTSVSIPSSTNSSQTQQEVENLRASAKDKSFTITARLSSWWDGSGINPKNWASGTTYHPGGLAMVNDQKGGIFREMVTLPSGEQFIPHGRNVILPLPRGSKVLRASQTRSIFPGLPQYAEGIGAQTTSPIIQQYGRTVNINATNNNALIRTLVVQNKKLNANFDDLKCYNKHLLELLETMDFDVYMDEYKVTKRIDRRLKKDEKIRNTFQPRRTGDLL
ncbi:phage tail tape measure protein [Aerococcus kribbianus]|uniref:Phage tail tape measure protein n=1 Tax=Aerococcus kribbianus TaxID=2999064 RepID=A0A9X3FQQ7_9LACT|nr:MULTISPECIES: phage tail tape measure protein [unclassified Aerococcus]MCZ0717827.1 phage tail tape measure protein [Aerococcus sp. YH-aer221]MCZ0726114.1 phage tail tape measure protein [Aerococcus sp. YH-aer222]